MMQVVHRLPIPTMKRLLFSKIFENKSDLKSLDVLLSGEGNEEGAMIERFSQRRVRSLSRAHAQGRRASVASKTRTECRHGVTHSVRFSRLAGNTRSARP